ncbi:hypothetical protein [Phytomonospora endophytica]|uniref:Lysophospholipase L1-like esterase n=1 Tax=Phytomonospora endophytica TaxID=714109 RepID=A0A841FW02_9ACTN|nr:hypothetical protein [Phytomonospora endophytica]MBB6036160.1 lysophospholipase L1-like esterase [Phytomonospora endophytica]GIG67064.1 hypothetical protein Pen01_33590 [Phytomonospora endophytica]
MSLRLRRFLYLAVTTAVTLAASAGLAAPANAQAPLADDQVKVDILGDSYNSGEGMRGTYFDPEDRRHRSPFASGSQALQRLQDANPDIDIDGQIGASSGATTRDVFETQEDADGNPVNPPQNSLVRPDADAVIMGFGGNDAQFAQVLTEAWRSATQGQSSPRFDRFMEGLEPLMDTDLSAEEYQRQAESTPGGQAPTIVARLLQAMREIQAKAPGAKLVVPNYPLPVNPEATSFWSRFSEYELQRFREFGTQLNRAIAKSVELCGCATVADMAGALDGREAYTDDPAINDLNAALTGRHDQWNSNEPFHPNVEGGGLMSDAIAGALAEALGLKPPDEGGATPTPFNELREAPDPEGFEPLTRGQRNDDDEDASEQDGKKDDSDAKDDGKGKGDGKGEGDGTPSADPISADPDDTPGTSDPGTADPGTENPDPGTPDPGTADPGTPDPGTSDPGTGTPDTSTPDTSDPVTVVPDSPPSDTPSHEGGDGGDPAQDPTTAPSDPAPPDTPPSNDLGGNPFGGGSGDGTPANSSGSPDDRDNGSDGSPNNDPGTPANSSGSPDDRDGTSGDTPGGGFGDGGSPGSDTGSDGGAPANSSGSPDDRDSTSGDSSDTTSGDSPGGPSGGGFDGGSDSGAPANSSGSPDDRDGTSGDTPGGGYGDDGGAPANSSGSPDDRDGTSGDTPGGGYSDSYGEGDGSCACW